MIVYWSSIYPYNLIALEINNGDRSVRYKSQEGYAFHELLKEQNSTIALTSHNEMIQFIFERDSDVYEPDLTSIDVTIDNLFSQAFKIRMAIDRGVKP